MIKKTKIFFFIINVICSASINSHQPSKFIVYHWFTEFKHGLRSLINEFKESGPKLNVPKLIEATMGISMTLVVFT